MKRGSSLMGAVAVLLASALSCVTSGPSEDMSLADSIQEAAVNTWATRTAHIDITGSVRNLALPVEQRIPFAGEGVIDFATGDAAYHLEFLGGSGIQLEVRIVHGVSYLKMSPECKLELPSGKEWVKTGDATEYDQFPGTPKIQRIVAHNPTDTLGYLRALGADVNLVGDDTIAGDKTMVYRTVVDLDDLVDQQLASTQDVAELRDFVGSDHIVTNVWVDRRGLVRQASTTWLPRLTVRGSTVNLEISETDRYSDFGVEALIEPPDPVTVIADTDPRLAENGEEC